MSEYPGLDITPIWSRLNDGLIRLVDYIPDDKMNWSPKPELWNFRGILLHIADARDQWMHRDVKDGGEGPSVWGKVHSKVEIQEAFRRTRERLDGLLRDEQRLDATYEEPEGPVTGHWIAYHLLEHDIHHRADIFHYLALLGIATPDVGTP